jgi:hypothetical protein
MDVVHPLFKEIYVYGRAFRIAAEVSDLDAARFLAKVDFESNSETGCWRWTGYTTPFGHGSASFKKKSHVAHKVAWAMFRGPLPDGLHLHHQTESPVNCMGPNCVNPDHLLPLTPRDHVVHYTPSNITAIRRNQTHCIRGHELSGDNLYIYPGTTKRRCRACLREWAAIRYRNSKSTPAPDVERTHCKNGHALAGDNVYEYIGIKQCKACHNVTSARYYEKHLSPRANPRPLKPAKTHCKHGHPWIPENLYTFLSHGKEKTICGICHKESGDRAYEKRKERFGKQ